MKSKNIVEKLNKYEELPVEILCDCPNPDCGYVFSQEIRSIFKSDRLNEDKTDLEDCLFLVPDESFFNSYNNACEQLTEIKRAHIKYEQALNNRENGVSARIHFLEAVEEILAKIDWIQIGGKSDVNS